VECYRQGKGLAGPVADDVVAALKALDGSMRFREHDADFLVKEFPMFLIFHGRKNLHPSLSLLFSTTS